MRGPKKVAPAAHPAPLTMPASSRALAAGATLTLIPARCQHHHALRPGHTTAAPAVAAWPYYYLCTTLACVRRQIKQACVVQADRLDIGVAHNV